MSVTSRPPTGAPRVEPARRDWLKALVEGDDVFTARFGIAVADGWAGFPEAVQPALDTARRHDGDPWEPYLVFDGDDGSLIGFGGFKGAPVDGAVEIGYAVAPSRQGRGVATAFASALIRRAAAAGVDTVVAHTVAEHNPSTSVLRRCGFEHVATLHDDDLGADVWRWELPLG